MRRLLRLLLLCTLVLALPLQGAWAAGLRADAAADHGAMTPHHAVHCPHAAPHAHGHAGPAKDACGACCGPLLAIVPTLAPTPPVMAPVRPERASPDAAPPAFLTGGLDRPPRTDLA
jgi:hypothetical protein